MLPLPRLVPCVTEVGVVPGGGSGRGGGVRGWVFVGVLERVCVCEGGGVVGGVIGCVKGSVRGGTDKVCQRVLIGCVRDVG